jgi:predicted DNA-binding protein
MNETLILKISKELKDWLGKQSYELKKSMAEIVRTLIEKEKNDK